MKYNIIYNINLRNQIIKMLKLIPDFNLFN